jgi:hypothetical protein
MCVGNRHPSLLFCTKRIALDWQIAKIPVQVYFSSLMAPFQNPKLTLRENSDRKFSGTPAPYGTVANVHHSRRNTLRDGGWFLDRTTDWFVTD